MKLEVERYGEEATLYNTITLNRVKEKEEEKIIGRGIEGENIGGEILVW